MDLTDIYRIFHPTVAVHGAFSRIAHLLGHKVSLSKLKKIKIMPCIYLDHNGMKLEISNSGISRAYANTWRLNDMLLNEQCVEEEIK